MTWKSIARRSTGTSHLNMQMPCQDYGDYCMVPCHNMVIGAVSDGAGSAKRSEIGSQLAVKTALNYMQSQEWHTRPNQREAQDIFEQVVKTVVAELKDKAISTNCEFRDFACTLLIFVATPSWLTAMQVGDGLLVVRSSGSNYKLLFKPDKGEFINETSFVTSSKVLDEMQVYAEDGRYEFICAATDGIERVAISYQNRWTPFEGFFKALEDYMLKTPVPEQNDTELVNFLESERLNAETDDDKTLLLCIAEDSILLQSKAIQDLSIPETPVQNKVNRTGLATSQKKQRQTMLSSEIGGKPSADLDMGNRELEEKCITHTPSPMLGSPKNSVRGVSQSNKVLCSSSSKEQLISKQRDSKKNNKNIEQAITECINNRYPNQLNPKVILKKTFLEVTIHSDENTDPKVFFKIIFGKIRQLKTRHIKTVKITSIEKKNNSIQWEKVSKVPPKKKTKFQRFFKFVIIVGFFLWIGILAINILNISFLFLVTSISFISLVFYFSWLISSGTAK